MAHLLFVGFIALLGWAATIALALATNFYLLRSNASEQERSADPQAGDPGARPARVIATLVMIVIAAALMTFNSVRQYGVSLMASAGAAGLMVGLALRPVLRNLFAGIQIAITRPIRIRDALIVENEWGWVAAIASTYVVLKLWDCGAWSCRCPISSRSRSELDLPTTELMGTVMLRVDYTVPAGAGPQTAEGDRPDGATLERAGRHAAGRRLPSTMRAACGRLRARARQPEAWDLRCEVRKKLIRIPAGRVSGGAAQASAPSSVDFGRRQAAAS